MDLKQYCPVEIIPEALFSSCHIFKSKREARELFNSTYLKLYFNLKSF